MRESNKKQLECELECKATAALDESVVNDLSKEDACLSELLEENEDKPKPIN